jgi:hypothetical protein
LNRVVEVMRMAPDREVDGLSTDCQAKENEPRT